jgi:hypothetical protein
MRDMADMGNGHAGMRACGDAVCGVSKRERNKRG